MSTSSAEGPRKGRPLLVLDTASPVVSVAVGDGDRTLATRTLELRRSSERLLGAVEEALEEAGTPLAELGGVAVLQGPGSFTGLRVGLATVLGWHQALGLPATAVPTLDVLAASAGSSPGAGREGAPRDVVAAVDALRGDWYVARYRVGASSEEPSRRSWRELPELAPCRLIGFGVAVLAEESDWPREAEIELVEPPPLAPVGLAVAAVAEWRSERLIAPIYFRAPAVTPPKRPGRAGASPS